MTFAHLRKCANIENMKAIKIFLIFCLFLLIPFFIEAQDFDEFLKIPSIPGRISGRGKFFEIKDSNYLNITLQSEKEIEIVLESIPRMISLNISSSTNATSTNLILNGLEPNKTYYKYQDSYKNGVVFISDEKGTFSWQQDLSQPHYIWIQEKKGTIFLTRDCSNYGIWETSTQTCTLTQDVTSTIEIDADNITLDCNGHQIKNEYWISNPILTHGIYFWDKKGVIIKNCGISGFDYGILFSYCSDIKIVGSKILRPYGEGLRIQFSRENEIFGNEILDSSRGGLIIYESSGNRLRENSFKNNGSWNFGIFGTVLENFIQDIDISNTINGKSIYYLVGQENKTIEAFNSPGYVGIINSKNIQIKNVSLLEPNYQQVLFINSQDSKIENSQIQNGIVAGIQILFSSNVEILKNKISNCYYAIYAGTIIGAEGKTLENGLISENELTENGGGISFENAFGNKILKNEISKNNLGIYFINSSNNVISENTISENEYESINLILSSNNTLKGNTILNNGEGILLSGSSNNIIFENSISKQNGQWGRGIYLSGIYTREGLVKSENNKVYHNNFIQNKINAKVESDYASGNLFDNGYPSGGNYWSDYTGVDEKFGPNQDQRGSDGIGDNPYCFQGGCDNYPFIKENGWQTLKVLISEVYYNVDKRKDKEGNEEKEGDNEWVIIHNLENETVDISNWQICDNEKCDNIPTSSIPANGFAILTPATTTFNFWKVPKDMVRIVLGSKFGSHGLSNEGDRVILKDREGKIIDAMSYGTDTLTFFPFCSEELKAGEGKSLLRFPPDKDTDTCKDFIESEPTIGKNQLPIPIIQFSPKNPVKGVKVKFDASSSTDPDGEILNFLWEIKRGEEILATSTGTTTEFTFPENGEYQINLIATDNDDATSSTSTIIKVQPFSFAIITDLHIGRHYQEEYEGQEYYLTQRLRNVVNWINNNKDEIQCENATCSIKFLVILGDITENTPLVGFCKAKEILDQLEIPYVPVFGNHDVGTDEEFKQCSKWKGQDYFDEVFWSMSPPCQNASSTKNFELLLHELNFQRDTTNPDYKNFSFSFGGINFIGLDFNSRKPFMKFGKGVGADAVLNEINKGWLEKKLEEFKGEPVILLAHHPFYKRSIDAFEKKEFEQIREILENQDVLIDFGGHIHSFEEWHGKFAPQNANINYDSINSTNVLTTEALMVGSNGRGVSTSTPENGVIGDKKGIIRIVKVSGKENINPYNWETTEKGDEFLAFNPKITLGFSIRRQFQNMPCIELEAHKFSEKPSYFVWNFGGDSEGECNSDLTECYVCYKQLGEYTIELFAKDKNSPFEERISKKINIQKGIFPRTIKKSVELIKAGIEFISEKAQMSFDKIGQIVKDRVKIFKTKSSSIPIGEITVHFENLTTDLNFTNLIADTDIQKSKTILYMEN